MDGMCAVSLQCLWVLKVNPVARCMVKPCKVLILECEALKVYILVI